MNAMKQSIFFVASVWAMTLIVSSPVNAHTYTTSVIVDTDMALDDIRALAMLQNVHGVNIRLIVTSDGATSPEKGCRNLVRLLKYFEKADCSVGKGEGLGKPAPPWRTWSEEFNWPDGKKKSNSTGICTSADEAILHVLENVDERVLYLCLGPLTNLANVISLHPDIEEKISSVIYYGGHPDAPEPGWNTKRDRGAAQLVFDSQLRILAFNPPEKKLLPFDTALLEEIGECDTVAANVVKSLHSGIRIKGLLSKGHFFIWDELPVIYLRQPSLFTRTRSVLDDQLLMVTDYNENGVRSAYVKAFKGISHTHLAARPTVTFKHFPVAPDFYKGDLKQYVSQIIGRHGLEEWKACVLTNELHRHLGAYSLIGAKMGIRAREMLNAPLDAVKVVSFAGNRPPLSCMNDGLQVATGASLGRGTIDVISKSPEASARFSYRGKEITLTLKEAFLDQIQTDIKAALKTYGGLTPEYFSHIRELAIGHWLNMDRKSLFQETEKWASRLTVDTLKEK